MAVGEEVGRKTLEDLNQNIPQWIMQLRQALMDVVDYIASYEFVAEIKKFKLIAGWRKKESNG